MEAQHDESGLPARLPSQSRSLAPGVLGAAVAALAAVAAVPGLGTRVVSVNGAAIAAVIVGPVAGSMHRDS